MVQLPYTEINKEDIIIAFSIGDGHLHKQNKAVNAYLDITHSEKQRLYALWKNDLLIHNGFRSHISMKHNACNGKLFPSYRVLTKVDSLITNVYENLYDNCGKNMDYVIKHLSPFVLAVWYMDDGSKKVKKRVRRKSGEIIEFHSGYIDAYMLATNGFSFEDCQKLCMALCDQFGIIGHVQSDRGAPRISISDNKSKLSFREIVYPFISEIPSMLYKIDGMITFQEAMSSDVNIGKTEGA